MKLLTVKTIVIALAGVGLGSLPAGIAWANPQGGTVVAGTVAIQQESATKLGVTQTSNKAIVDWRSFSIGANEHTQFYQPSSSAVILNRVVGEDPSKILGRLTANGQVFLVNPNGILFGKGAQIDVASLVATTHNIRNEDFLAGRYNFDNPGKTNAAVINEGTIRIADTGIAAFVAPSVANRGLIVARLGKVAMGAANGFTLDLQGDQLVNFLVSDEVAQTAFDTEGKQLTSFVESSGRIEANGGHVLLTAKAAEGVVHGVINMSGSIEARTIDNRKGEILLLGGNHGKVEVSGTLDATAPNGGDGGFIETSGADVRIADSTQVTTAAPYGKTGNWLIDPNDYTIAASGGNITGTALSNNLANTDVTISTATQGTAGGNGDIFVNDSVNWSSHTLTLNAERNIQISTVMSATGTAGLDMNTGSGDKILFGFNNNGEFRGKINLGHSSSLSINGNPYVIINDANGLQAMRNNLSGYYALGSNIDATSTIGWNSGIGFVPIGFSSPPLVSNMNGWFNGIQPVAFNGSLNGLGHSINGLYINLPNINDVGLFSVIGQLGKVENVSLTNSNINGNAFVGGLAGNNIGNIEFVHSNGDISAGLIVGGLVGFNNNYNFVDSPAIRYSSSSGSVHGEQAGGFVGYNNTTGIIENSYSTANVYSVGYLGGFVGANVGVITNCYSIGLLSSDNGTALGGLIGGSHPTLAIVNNSYWDIQLSGMANSDGGIGLTTAQMKTMSSFSGWDIANTPGTGSVWYITEGSTYPLLNAFYTAPAITLPPPPAITPPPTTPTTPTPTNNISSTLSLLGVSSYVSSLNSLLDVRNNGNQLQPQFRLPNPVVSDRASSFQLLANELKQNSLPKLSGIAMTIAKAITKTGLERLIDDQRTLDIFHMVFTNNPNIPFPPSPLERLAAIDAGLTDPELALALGRELNRKLALDLTDAVMTAVVKSLLINAVGDTYEQIYGSEARKYFDLIASHALSFAEMAAKSATVPSANPVVSLTAMNLEVWSSNLTEFYLLGESLVQSRNQGTDMPSQIAQAMMWDVSMRESLIKGVLSGPAFSDQAGKPLTEKMRNIFEENLASLPALISEMRAADEYLAWVQRSAETLVLAMDTYGREGLMTGPINALKR